MQTHFQPPLTNTQLYDARRDAKQAPAQFKVLADETFVFINTFNRLPVDEVALQAAFAKSGDLAKRLLNAKFNHNQLMAPLVQAYLFVARARIRYALEDIQSRKAKGLSRSVATLNSEDSEFKALSQAKARYQRQLEAGAAGIRKETLRRKLDAVSERLAQIVSGRSEQRKTALVEDIKAPKWWAKETDADVPVQPEWARRKGESVDQFRARKQKNRATQNQQNQRGL